MLTEEDTIKSRSIEGVLTFIKTFLVEVLGLEDAIADRLARLIRRKFSREIRETIKQMPASDWARLNVALEKLIEGKQTVSENEDEETKIKNYKGARYLLFALLNDILNLDQSILNFMDMVVTRMRPRIQQNLRTIQARDWYRLFRELERVKESVVSNSLSEGVNVSDVDPDTARRLARMSPQRRQREIRRISKNQQREARKVDPRLASLLRQREMLDLRIKRLREQIKRAKGRK